MKLTRSNILPVILSFATTSALAEVDDGQLSCLLEPSQEINIASQVQGVVKRVNGERGDSVQKGKALIWLEQGVENAEVNLAREKLEFSERKLERNQDLIETGLLTDYEADEIRTEQNLFELELRLAEARLQQKIIYSPVNGIIVERMVSTGEYAGIEPLMTLAVLDPLHAEVVMNAGYYGQVQTGMTVDIFPEERPDESYTGKVKIVDQIVDAASGTFGVRIELTNPDFKLPAGLRCRVHYREE